MRTLHNGADRDGERLAAVLAVVDASAEALAFHLLDAVAHDAAARANRTLRPQHRFEIFASGFVIVEDRIAEVDFAASHRTAFQLSGNPSSMNVLRQPDSSLFNCF